MNDPVMEGLERAIDYIQGAIRCRRANDLGANDVNITRAYSELDGVEMVLSDERIRTEGISGESS